ncbi:MAG TPA: hypothetical protein VFX49_15490 [Chloroflexota bacterium]|nr:hypothetical protein [Chloroflexota bacterium]
MRSTSLPRAYNGKVNANVRQFDAEARSRAKEADGALARGQSWRCRHPTPMTRCAMPRLRALGTTPLHWRGTKPLLLTG